VPHPYTHRRARCGKILLARVFKADYVIFYLHFPSAAAVEKVLQECQGLRMLGKYGTGGKGMANLGRMEIGKSLLLLDFLGCLVLQKWEE
jgi:hypothetical protein